MLNAPKSYAVIQKNYSVFFFFKCGTDAVLKSIFIYGEIKLLLLVENEVPFLKLNANIVRLAERIL